MLARGSSLQPRLAGTFGSSTDVHFVGWPCTSPTSCCCISPCLSHQRQCCTSGETVSEELLPLNGLIKGLRTFGNGAQSPVVSSMILVKQKSLLRRWLTHPTIYPNTSWLHLKVTPCIPVVLHTLNKLFRHPLNPSVLVRFPVTDTQYLALTT